MTSAAIYECSKNHLKINVFLNLVQLLESIYNQNTLIHLQSFIKCFMLYILITKLRKLIKNVNSLNIFFKILDLTTRNVIVEF